MLRGVVRQSERIGRPMVVRVLLDAMSRVDDDALAAAIESGNGDRVRMALAPGFSVGGDLAEVGFRDLLWQTGRIVGEKGARILTRALGHEVGFQPFSSRILMQIRIQMQELTADLERSRNRGIAEAVAVPVRNVAWSVMIQGLTTAQAVKLLKSTIGLPPNWLGAPSALREELESGRFTESRRLSSRDKKAIRKQLASGKPLSPAFVERMVDRYTESLIDLRARTIVRTEMHRAAAETQREGWRQAMQAGQISPIMRRAWIVTPDDRLRPDHAAIPGMNPDGVRMDEQFQTPMGPAVGPPLDPNCRCGEGLIIPGLGGLL